MTTTVNRSSPTKSRRGRAAVRELREIIAQELEVDHPMTVRQVYYRLVTMGAIDKTEMEYKATVCRLLGIMRREGQIPFGWIADNTRWMRKPRTFSSSFEALENSARTYRKSLWDAQEYYCEVWLEKEALAGVLYQETQAWDVPLMVCRGYPSLSFVYEAADAMQAQEKPVFLFYFGDHDPSGVDIPRSIQDGIIEFAPDVELHFKRVAVTAGQIEEFSLPTRPTKKTDSRAKKFAGESVEVDAIPPAQLRNMVRESIESCIDADALEVTKLVEKVERETMQTYLDGFKQANNGGGDE